MRKFAVAVLGLLSGLVVGFLLTETIAVTAVFGVGGGQLPDSPLLALLLRSLTPVLAMVGVVVALISTSGRAARTARRRAGGRRWHLSRCTLPPRLERRSTRRRAGDLRWWHRGCRRTRPIPTEEEC